MWSRNELSSLAEVSLYIQPAPSTAVTFSGARIGLFRSNNEPKTLARPIQEAAGLSLAPQTGYTEWGLSWFSLISPEKCLGSAVNLATTRTCRSLSLLSDAFFSSVIVLLPNGQSVGCATIAFGEIFIPDDDLVQVETCRKDINDKLLFITGCAVCWIKHCTLFKLT